MGLPEEFTFMRIVRSKNSTTSTTCPAVAGSLLRAVAAPRRQAPIASRKWSPNRYATPSLRCELTLIPFKDYQSFMCTPNVLYWMRACSCVCFDLLCRLCLLGSDPITSVLRFSVQSQPPSGHRSRRTLGLLTLSTSSSPWSSLGRSSWMTLHPTSAAPR